MTAARPQPAESSAPLPMNQEERLAELVENLLSQIRRGERPELEQVVAHHPDLEVELRDLWGTLLMAEDLGRSSLGSQSPATITPTPPREFADYELLDELGRGGMGVVYKARQKSLGRIVALKLLLRGPHASSTDVARFRAEAEAIAQLDDPHIIPVYEVGEQEGQPYFAMRFVEGETLSSRLQQGPLTSHQAAALLLPVSRAIAAAHAHNILHRDLKPSNILLDRADHSHVTDFGLAKRLEAEPSDASDSLTFSGAIIGTPSYMAPEQAAGSRTDVGPASDIYSLGAVLYQMLTGRPPFQAASPLDTLRMVQEQDPLPPRLLNPKVDPDLEMIALKCLQKPPELRYKSAAALAGDLDAFLKNEPISARNTRVVEVLSRLFRETHHAGLLENWGLLWMWHGVVLLILCVATNILHSTGVNRPGPYFWFWTLGLGAWISIFWALRYKAGPITFVERQIAHVWAGSVICSTLLFGVEVLLKLPVLTLSPALALASGSVFLVKAGILSGLFYIPAVALYLTAFVMAAWPQYGLSIFGVVSCLCFFLPGLKYYRQQRQRQEQLTSGKSPRR